MVRMDLNIHDIDADAPGGGLSYDKSLYGAGFDELYFYWSGIFELCIW